jgi:diaminohydroxyphosphoribosylaminopyrimidine deaminase/5-amino-6-(5-phosphoribosylamino)uracil reductase
MDTDGADGIHEATWQGVLAGSAASLAACPLYAPFAGENQVVLGRITQSLDGRIATPNGASFWIGGKQDVLHTHRLRALSDAVIVGGGTIRADDPQLTTRLCDGPSPLRVVIDTERRLTDEFRIFQTGTPSLLLCGTPGPARIGNAEIQQIPRDASGMLDAHAIIHALRSRGLARIFIEGGGLTVSRFLQAGALDRLHVTVAPLLLGAGIPAFTLPGVAHPEQGHRVTWTVHRLGDDVLMDIPLRRMPQ